MGEEGGGAEYHIVAAPRAWRSASEGGEGERRLLACMFPQGAVELGRGSWHVVAGTGATVEEGQEGDRDMALGSGSMSAKRGAFMITEVEEDGDAANGGARVVCTRGQETTGGSRYLMLYVEKEGSNVFYAAPVTDMYRCIATLSRPPKQNKGERSGGTTAVVRNRILRNSDHARLALQNIGAETGGLFGGLEKEIGMGDNDWEHEHGVASDDDEALGFEGEAVEEPEEAVKFGWEKMTAQAKKEEEEEADAILNRILDDELTEEGTQKNVPEKQGGGENGSEGKSLPGESEEAKAKPSTKSDGTETAKVTLEEAKSQKRPRDETNTVSHPKAKTAKVDSLRAEVKTSVVSAEEIKAMLRLNGGQMTSVDLSKAFKSRLSTTEEKKMFAVVVKSVAKKSKDRKMIVLK